MPINLTMKISTLIAGFLLLFISAGIKAQGLAPSTVRQVFSLEKGDSLEYRIQTIASNGSGCNVLCDVYRLNTIDSVYYNAIQDSLTIRFTSQIIYKDTFATLSSNGCGNCRSTFWVEDYFNISTGKWIVTNLDSNIVLALDNIYGPNCIFSRDTSFADRLKYNGSKENYYRVSDCSMIYWEEIYVDSVGIVYKTEVPGVGPDNTEQLIYYHKASGHTWGTPFINTGIGNIGNEYPISVYPNPAQGRFIVKTDLYQGVKLELYDMLSKEVLNRELTGRETEVNSSGLAPGIYYWKLNGANQLGKGGKLVIE